MSVPRLVLVPASSDWSSITTHELNKFLQEMQLAGDALSPGYFAAGPAFLDYLSFLGCAPTVVFAPPSDGAIGTGQFYHIGLAGPLDQEVFRSDSMTYRPKCPHCKTGLDDWRLWWGEGGCGGHSCSNCGELVTPQMINWRRRAGCGRVFIEILGIHAETVKPVQKLFDELEVQTGTTWQYFFVEDNGA